MLLSRVAVIGIPVALLGACAAEVVDEEVEPGEIAAELVEDETSPRDILPEATLERPCAGRTVTQIQVRNGNRMSFCVLGEGKAAFVEVASGDRGSYLEEVGIRNPAGICAVDLYMEVTDESKPLPLELLDACPPELRRRRDYDSRRPIRGGYFEEIREPLAGSYCGANGKANALAECPVCDPYDDCVVICNGGAYGWHQHTLSVNMGEEGNIALDRNGSCNGKTLVRGWDREDIGDSWGTPDINFWLNSGAKSWTGFIYHSGFLGQDYDFKLRGDSQAGAFHRYGSYFEDE
jgi:hypothetical protein